MIILLNFYLLLYQNNINVGYGFFFNHKTKLKKTPNPKKQKIPKN